MSGGSIMRCPRNLFEFNYREDAHRRARRERVERLATIRKRRKTPTPKAKPEVRP
jgi:hypothetical protein